VGNYKAKAVIIKQTENLKIVFYNHESIYVEDKKQGWVVFHRWFAPRGSYNGGWRQFRHLLLYEKKPTLIHCYHLAFRYDIQVQKVRGCPDLSKFKIQERFC